MNTILPEIELEKNTFQVIIDNKDFPISKEEIASLLGYAANSIPHHFDEMIETVIKELPAMLDIKAGYQLYDVNNLIGINNGLKIGGKFFTLEKIVTAQLKNSERAALFLGTIGPAMESQSKKLISEGDTVQGFIFDTVASVAAERVADCLHEHILNKMLRIGLKVTNKFSPGYCNWHVEEQHLLFSLLPEKFCGVSLTDSALMIPIKSVSGIIGIGKEAKYTDYLCDKCGVKDCTYGTKRLSK